MAPEENKSQLERGYKRLIICCDGTWQASDRPSAKDGANVTSNVTKFCRALAKSTKRADGRGEVQQVVFYQSGIGTDTITKFSETIAGAFGYGLAENVVEAYNYLSLNYEEGDEIFLFGFSRGAFTARSLAGLVSDIGILDKMHMPWFPLIYSAYQMHEKYGAEEALRNTPLYKNAPEEKRPKIKVVGCWDTVGSLGVPDTWLTSFRPFSWWKGANQFHNTGLSDAIENAFHALALDEHRQPFTPTLWHLPKNSKTNLVQCWFPGYHINVGGGSNDTTSKNPKGDLEQLADITFGWMVDLCEPFLEFDGLFMHIHKRHHGHRVMQHKTSNISGWGAGKLVDSFAGEHILGGSRTRSPGEYKPDPKLAKMGEEYVTNEYMHCSVRIRLERLGSEGWIIESKALKGFDRVEDPDADAKDNDMRSGWKWVKKVGERAITIPEMRVRRTDESFSIELGLMDNETLDMVNKGTKAAKKLVDVN